MAQGVGALDAEVDETVAANLSAGNLAEAVDLAASAMDVRGYERLKLERGGAFREGLERRLAAFA